MITNYLNYDLTDVATNNICLSQAPGGAGNLTLNGSLVSGGTVTFDVPRQIGITSSGNDSTRTFTVTGKDADGVTQTEAITGPNATTVESTKYWQIITQIAISAASVGNITVGTVDEALSPTIPLDVYSPYAANIYVDVTGTINFTVQQSFEEIMSAAQPSVSGRWLDITALAAKTADTYGNTAVGATGFRLVVNSYTNGAEVRISWTQTPAYYN